MTMLENAMVMGAWPYNDPYDRVNAVDLLSDDEVMAFCADHECDVIVFAKLLGLPDGVEFDHDAAIECIEKLSYQQFIGQTSWGLDFVRRCRDYIEREYNESTIREWIA